MPEKWKRALPRVMGHEFSGRVVTDTTGGLTPGTLVAVEPGIGCGRCDNCRDGYANLCPQRSILGIDREGAFAPLVTAPSANVHVVPADMDEVSAAFLEVFAIAIHAQERAKLLPHERALVVGSGPIGISLVALCVRAGLVETVVVGTQIDSEFRLPLAEKLGAKAVLAKNLPDSAAFDVVFETSGSAAGVRGAIAACRTGGRVVAIGTPEGMVELNWNEIVMRGIRVVPIRARLPRHWNRAAAVLSTMRMPDGFFSQFSLPDAVEAFEEATLRRGLKVMIRPDGR
jgi:threonine dehydrogenase-like Zn-dependent dehydrogenase